MPVRKYFTEEDYKQAQRDNTKRWRETHREERRASARAYYHRHKDRIRQERYHQIIPDYGISLADRDEMIKRQDGKCPICNNLLQGGQKQAIDHCHTTGKVRAVLCTRCNLLVGFIEKDFEHTVRALDYIAQHRGINNTTD